MSEDRILGIVLAGGEGTRLHPLIWVRSKPAVPFGDRYRIVDFRALQLRQFADLLDLYADAASRAWPSGNGAPSVQPATKAVQAGRTVDQLRQSMLAVQSRSDHNKATCALANKLARICYATLRDEQDYGRPAPRPNKKIERTAFAIAA